MNPACLSRPSARANISRSAFLLFVFLFFFAMRISIDICYVLKVKTYFCLSEHTPHLNESLRVCSKVYLLGCTDYTHTQYIPAHSLRQLPVTARLHPSVIGKRGTMRKQIQILIGFPPCRSE